MSSGFVEDSRIVQELETALEEVAATFSQTYDPQKKSWPYELRSSADSPTGTSSQTTTAMILCAALAMRNIWATLGRPRASSAISYWQDFPLASSLCSALDVPKSGPSVLSSATKKLLQRWALNSTHPRGPITESRTFGTDDPMSLGWAIDLLRYFHRTNTRSGSFSKLESALTSRCLSLASALRKAAEANDARGGHGNRSFCGCLMSPTDGRQVGDSSYLLVRFAALLRSLTWPDGKKTSSKTHQVVDRTQLILYERFESRLHEQLSFAGITDSRFDPTELAFCLEGMLLVRSDTVTKVLFDRVMNVLRTVQEAGGYWRSETPMIYHERGDVLFTVSVESANAILAACSMFDKRWSIHDTVASDHIDLLKRYWKWLKARKSLVRIGGVNLNGWHSEHVNDPNLIHLWETSQVAEFLVNFRDQLKRHIARTTLRLAGCSTSLPTAPKGLDLHPSSEDPKKRWEAVETAFEPVTSLGEKYRVYREIGMSFVAPRTSKTFDDASYSMLLYGPPGTGKTSVAANLSWALDHRKITVTVSDFLADGAAAIETRAKDLFSMLMCQPRSVVLFDEIDQFLLDRESEFFREQDTVFQFLTPGMLTKLNALRESRSVIFIVATNYAERIDRAIKRPGRIDRHFLLLPPDTIHRRGIIDRLLSLSEKDAQKLAVDSVFQGYPAFQLAQQNSKEEYLRERSTAAAIPETYSSRFIDRENKLILDRSKTPALEFMAMLSLEAEAVGRYSKRGLLEFDLRKKCRAIFPTKDFQNSEPVFGNLITDFVTGRLA